MSMLFQTLGASEHVVHLRQEDHDLVFHLFHLCDRKSCRKLALKDRCCSGSTKCSCDTLVHTHPRKQNDLRLVRKHFARGRIGGLAVSVPASSPDCQDAHCSCRCCGCAATFDLHEDSRHPSASAFNRPERTCSGGHSEREAVLPVGRNVQEGEKARSCVAL